MDTEKDYGEAHLNPLQRQNMRIFIEATKSLMDSVGEEGLSIRKIAAKAGYNSATIYREDAALTLETIIALHERYLHQASLLKKEDPRPLEEAFQNVFLFVLEKISVKSSVSR